MYSQDRGLTEYLNAIARYEPLAPGEDKTASRERLITANLKLAVHIAKKTARDTDELLENIQYANEGLCRATESYDPERGGFAHHAAYRMREVIKNNRVDKFGHRLYKRKSHDVDRVSIDDTPMADSPRLSLDEYAMLEQLDRVLTPRQLDATHSALQGYTREETAAHMGISHQAVSQAIRAGLDLLAVHRRRAEI